MALTIFASESPDPAASAVPTREEKGLPQLAKGKALDPDSRSRMWIVKPQNLRPKILKP